MNLILRVELNAQVTEGLSTALLVVFAMSMVFVLATTCLNCQLFGPETCGSMGCECYHNM